MNNTTGITATGYDDQ